MRIVHWIALVLVIVGALNWGLIGFFQIDVIGGMFGGMSSGISRVIFSLVGLAGLWCFSIFKRLGSCSINKR